jgi:hypothetical protein
MTFGPRCDKCVNTMLLLQQAGQLEKHDVFEVPQSFVPLLDALPHTTFVRVYRARCQRGLSGELEAALQRLLISTEQENARAAFRKRVRRVLDKILCRSRRRV